MSAEATRWAWQQALKPTTKLVLLALADRANPGGECWPSTARLIKDTGLYRETIHSAIQSLEAGKMIQVSRASGRGNIYHLLIQASSNQSEKADPTSLVLPTTQAAKADYHQSAKADTNLSIEPSINQSLILKDIDATSLPKKIEDAQQTSEELFLIAWSHYPARSGGNPKTKAQKAWNARLQAGANPQEIIDGVIRYRAWCESTGKVGTEYVKQAATFFGPDQHYLEPLTISAKTTTGANPYANKRQQSASIAQQIFSTTAQLYDANPAGYSGDGCLISADDRYLPQSLD